MIVRYALKCRTCGKPHTARIAMGHDTSQTHKFPCRGCSEPIVLRMDLNHERFSWRVVCVENCAPIDEVVDAPIVYVDANFVIPPEQQGVDKAFPRFAHMRAMFAASQRTKPSAVMVMVPPTNPSLRPYRPPDYAKEWKLLRKAWSLARHGQMELSAQQIARASKKFYPPEHAIDDLQNWVWRLTTLLCNPGYEPLLDGVAEAIEPIRGSELWRDFVRFYETVSEERGRRYFRTRSAVLRPDDGLLRLV
jgi:hypothetical protein